jgi:hypothetical protein
MNMKINTYILSLFLFIGFMVVITPAIPHHHHSNGVICIRDDMKADDCCSSSRTPQHHPNNDPCCTDNCLTQLVETESALQKAEPIQPHYIQLTVLYTESLLRTLTPPLEIPDHLDYVYLESLHGTYIIRAAGLRAPPFTV